MEIISKYLVRIGIAAILLGLLILLFNGTPNSGKEDLLYLWFEVTTVGAALLIAGMTSLVGGAIRDAIYDTKK